MKKIAIIIFCICSFLSAAENEKKCLYFGLRLGGGIGLSAPSEYYKELFLEYDKEMLIIEDENNRDSWFYAASGQITGMKNRWFTAQD